MFYSHPLPFSILGFLAVAVASVEWGKLSGRNFPSLLGAILVFAFFPIFGVELPEGWLFPSLFLLFCVGVASAWLAGKKKQGSVLFGELGSLWFAIPIVALMLLHQRFATTPWDFKTPLLMAFLPLWGGDTAGIFVGKAFGKHKLAPAISPKKTVEGAVGNLVLCLLVAWGVGTLLALPPWVSLVCGLFTGVLGQAGDLFESALKRAIGVKDSGSILPGHGGVLDRIDSLLFSSIPVAWLISEYLAKR